MTGALLVLATLWLLPVVWMAVTSLKPTENIVRVPPEWVPWPATLAHYGEVLFSSSRTARIGRAFLNSVIVSLGTVVLVLVTSAMAAYPLARMRFPGRDLVFVVLVGSLMIPNAVVLVPQYVLTQRLGWLSTYQGLIVPEAAVTFAFGVFLLRQFFLTIPGELEDAARIDGAEQLAHLLAHRAAAVAAGAGGARDLRLPVRLERLPLAAHRRQQGGDVPAAGRPVVPPRRLRVRVVRADHGGGDALRRCRSSSCSWSPTAASSRVSGSAG